MATSADSGNPTVLRPLLRPLQAAHGPAQDGLRPADRRRAGPHSPRRPGHRALPPRRRRCRGRARKGRCEEGRARTRARRGRDSPGARCARAPRHPQAGAHALQARLDRVRAARRGGGGGQARRGRDDRRERRNAVPRARAHRRAARALGRAAAAGRQRGPQLGCESIVVSPRGRCGRRRGGGPRHRLCERRARRRRCGCRSCFCDCRAARKTGLRSRSWRRCACDRRRARRTRGLPPNGRRRGRVALRRRDGDPR